jgi:hypothetical protein
MESTLPSILDQELGEWITWSVLVGTLLSSLSLGSQGLVLQQSSVTEIGSGLDFMNLPKAKEPIK